tara:strand:- start:53 stop:265 length:213 start_codon:yes stop_codon:yes gene_type:complete
MNIFEKRKYIETDFKIDHIKKLKANDVPYRIRERRFITTAFKKIYVVYSVILDCIVLGGIIWALFNFQIF